jgi:hypothetical protein
MKRALLLAAAAFALAACGEKPQYMKENAKQDTAPWLGPVTPFVVPGWKVGNETSWEAELRTRTENGQNDYTRIN